MPQTETHSANNADGHCLLIHSLLGTDIAFHLYSSFLLIKMYPYRLSIIENSKNQKIEQTLFVPSIPCYHKKIKGC
jgi:hypothetical protein